MGRKRWEGGRGERDGGGEKGGGGGREGRGPGRRRGEGRRGKAWYNCTQEKVSQLPSHQLAGGTTFSFMITIKDGNVTLIAINT